MRCFTTFFLHQVFKLEASIIPATSIHRSGENRKMSHTPEIPRDALSRAMKRAICDARKDAGEHQLLKPTHWMVFGRLQDEGQNAVMAIFFGKDESASARAIVYARKDGTDIQVTLIPEGDGDMYGTEYQELRKRMLAHYYPDTSPAQ
jgi:hypothetical protein